MIESRLYASQVIFFTNGCWRVGDYVHCGTHATDPTSEVIYKWSRCIEYALEGEYVHPSRHFEPVDDDDADVIYTNEGVFMY